MWNKIVNPKTGKKVNVNSIIGKTVIKQYINNLNINQNAGADHQLIVY